MLLKRSSNRKIMLFFLGGLLGALVFVCIFGFSPLNVCNDSFCRGGFVEKDIQQHYAGWLFLRQSPLSFPFCLAEGINYPSGISVAYTDSIPLFAALFRLVNGILPKTFQYFGFFSLLCFFLQGGFAALLLGLFFEGFAAPLLGSLFFSCSPIMVERTLHHTALAAHFFILAAIYYYFRSTQEKRIFYLILWFFNAFTITVHPYLVPMAYAVTFAMLVKYSWEQKTLKAPCLFLTTDLAATVFLGWCFGTFGTGGTGGSEMLYGYFSMNLNALWNPTSLGTKWSLFLPVQNQIRGNYDSFNYLGAAILLLTVVGLFLWLRKPASIVKAAKEHWALAAVCFCLTAFAVTNQVTANGAALLTLPLPPKLLALCSIFRASGRLFWPVYYLIMLFAFISLCHLPSQKLMMPILCAALALQLADISPALLNKHTQMTHYREQFPSELTNSFWRDAARFKHIFSLDELQEDALHLALFAADHRMTTNDPFAARFDATSLAAQRSETIEHLLNGQAEPDTLYLCRQEATFLKIADALSESAWCGVVDGKWYAIAPGLQGWQGENVLAYDADYPLTIADYTDDNWKNGVLSWDNCTVIFYDVPFTRSKIMSASCLVADGTTYPITKIDDRDAGWLMVTLDTTDAAPLCGAVLETR